MAATNRSKDLVTRAFESVDTFLAPQLVANLPTVLKHAWQVVGGFFWTLLFRSANTIEREA